MKNHYLLPLLAAFLFLLGLPGLAQVRTVKGVLVDPASGAPLPGVTIVVKGTATGTTTDANGYYELQAPVGSTLVISFIGFTTREVKVPPLTGAGKAAENHQPARLDSLRQETAKAKTFHHTVPDGPGDQTLSPYFFVQSDDPATDAMPLKSTAARVNISGVIAEVAVTQVYVNEGKHPLEAIYIFPGSTRAAVYGLTMRVGGRRITAKIQEKGQARQTYERAVASGKTATLLEQKRPNVFQMNVGNILPGDTVAVELQYTELLTATDGTYEFVYPTVVGPRYSETPDEAARAGEKWVQNPYLTEGKAPSYAFDLTTHLNAGLPIQRVFSPSHGVHITFADRNTAQVTLNPSETAGGNRDYVLRYRLRGGAVTSGLLLHPGADENFFLLMVQPPERPTDAQIPPREYVFIVDVSGSMNGFPLEASKELMHELLGNLRPQDRFNVILFAGTSNIFADGASVEATPRNVSQALAFLDRQQGSGGTSLLPALQRALALRGTEGYARTFAVITDGYVDVEKQAFELVKKNLDQASFFAFGIGSAVNRHLIEGLAYVGMGEPFFALDGTEARRVGEKFRRLIEQPVLTDIRLDFGGLDVYDVEPGRLPDVFAQRPVVVFGKYRGTPSGTVRLSGLSGQSAYTQALDVAAARTDHNGALRYLWARERVRYWDDFAGFFEQAGNYYNTTGKMPHLPGQQQAITGLGLKYNLLTAYTSFVAVDSLVRPAAPPVEVKQPLPLPEGVSNFAVRGAVAGVQVQPFSPVMGLTPDVKCLSEVVVVGYGTQQRKDLTASVASVEPTARPSPAGTPAEGLLQGRVSGVAVTQNAGTPGGSTAVRIRGHATLALAGGPLYVVDGIPLDNAESDNGPGGYDNANRLSDLPATDIESIQVIKGGAATALYGSRGAHGVIVITTRNGRNKWGKRPKVDFSSTLTAEEANRLPEVQGQFAQGRPLAGQPAYREADEPFSWGPAVGGLERADDGRVVVRGGGNGTPVPVYGPRAFFRTGLAVRNALAVGHDQNRYGWNVHLGNLHQRGILPNTGLQRNTVKLSGYRTLGNLKLDAQGWYAGTGSRQVLRGDNPSGVLLGLLATPPTFDNRAGYERTDGTQRRAGDAYDNPYWSSRKNGQRTGVHRWVGALGAEYELSDKVQMRYKMSADGYTDERRAGVDRQSAGAATGYLMDRREQFLGWQSALIFTHRQPWNDFFLQTNAGFTYRAAGRRIDRTDGTDLRQAGVFSPGNAASLTSRRQDFRQRNGALLTRAALNWRGAVTLEGGMVHEWTTTLPTGYLFSPSAGVSVQLAELLSMQGGAVSGGKLFGSYGQVAKEAPLFVEAGLPLAYAPLSTTTYGFERVATGNGALARPETNRTWEAGTAWQFLNGRLSVQGVCYRTRTHHLYVPHFDGPAVRLQNGGTLLNRGLEVDVEATALRAGAFTWNAAVRFTRARSLVEALAVDRVALGGFAEASASLVAGQPYGVLYGTRYARDAQGALLIGPDGFPQADAAPGALGDPNPDWRVGMENTLVWKGLKLMVLLEHQQGGVRWNGTRGLLDYLGTSAGSAEARGTTGYVFAGVTPEGTPNGTPVNFAGDGSLAGNRWVRYGAPGVAEDYIERASWFRLRQVDLTYTFGRNGLGRFRLDRLSVSVFAQNPWLRTRYAGVDPETGLSGNANGRGLDYFNTPNVRSFGASLRVGL